VILVIPDLYCWFIFDELLTYSRLFIYYLSTEYFITVLFVLVNLKNCVVCIFFRVKRTVVDKENIESSMSFTASSPVSDHV